TEAIARACSSETFRGEPGHNTKPIASAPTRAAASASSTRVMPQILTRVRVIACEGSCKRNGNRPTGGRERPLRLVLDAREIEAIGCERRGRASAVAALEQLADPARRLLARANVDECTNDVADHVMKVGIRAEVEADHIPCRGDRYARQGSHRTLR